jgi:hypothetical protein
MKTRNSSSALHSAMPSTTLNSTFRERDWGKRLVSLRALRLQPVFQFDLKYLF